MRLLIDSLETPIGPLHVVTDEASLCAVDFGAPEDRLGRLLAARFGRCELRSARDPLGATSALSAYFRGAFDAVLDLPFDGGGTAFQRRVWAALRTVPAGEVATYGAIARRIGAPRAARAVGHANSLNPVGIVVPCHRIVGAGGALTGYGGGLERKAWLLRHEGARF